MQRAVLIAAMALLVLAAVMPFTSLGVWAVVPVCLAIVGAVGLILWATWPAPEPRPPSCPAQESAGGESPRTLKLPR